jgi:ComF family protein
MLLAGRQYLDRSGSLSTNMTLSVDSAFDRFEGWLLPPRCVLCNAPGQPGCLDLCADCERDFPSLPQPCPRCGLVRSGPPRDGACDPCRAEPPPYDRCHAAFEYAFPVDGLVQSLKYGGKLSVARVLGTLLARSVAQRGLHLDVDVLVPIPLHPGRHAERGFNQSFEVARWVARGVRRPCDPRRLVRTRATLPQVGLPTAERATNLGGAFAVAGDIAGRRVVLIDDVVTTGSTIGEASRALRRAGAFSIDVWCVARTAPGNG